MRPLDTALSNSPSAPAAALRLAPERAVDGPAVDALMRRAFGPGHFAKVSERLREGNVLRADLSVCVWTGETLLGAVRMWPVRASGGSFLFLGPLGVEPAVRGQGLSKRLIDHACRAATEAGEPLVALVGAKAVFEPCGFSVVPPGRLVLPGPVDVRRIFWKALRDGGETGIAGPVTIAPDLGRAPA